MILYVNGDSHTAAAEATNPHAFAEDDPAYNYLHRLPHPANLAVSWGRRLSDNLKCTFKCDAESAASNTRIIRTTREWIEKFPEHLPRTLMIIQWSTWEREEWLINSDYYQINGSGIDHVPASHREKYKEFVANIDWQKSTRESHQKIWDFHRELEDKKISHIFFNGNNHFGDILESDRRDWGLAYISPYDPEMTYDRILKSQGHDTVSSNSWHFGEAAHGAWARFMLQYIVKNKLVR